MDPNHLEQAIERHFAAGAPAINDPAAMESFLALRDALERGEFRSACPDSTAPTGWRVNPWVKKGILLGFRIGVLQDFPAGALSFVDKHTFPVRHFTAHDGIRVVMHGSSIRARAYIARG